MVSRPNRWYTSLEQTKRDYLNIDSAVTDHDEKIKALIKRVSAWIEHKKQTGRVFYPVTDTRHFDFQSAKQVVFGDDLLSFTLFQYEDETIDSDNVFLYPLDGPPYLWAEIDYSIESMSYDDTPQKTITIEGDFGYCNDTEDTGATVGNDPLAADGTSLTAATGLIETGWMLLIESEQIFVSAVTAGETNDAIAIVRAQGGTTAAAHASGKTIYRYVPPWDIEHLCGIEVARAFHRGTTAWADRTGTPETGLTYMKSMTAESRDIIAAYKRLVYAPVRPMR